MLLCKDKPNEYDIVKLKEKLLQYYEKSEVMATEQTVSNMKILNINQLFAYPKQFMDDFVQTVDKMSDNILPVLIRGSQGSGKSTLSRFIASKSMKIPYILSLNDTPRLLQKKYLEYGLSQFDTVIVESLECAMPELLSVLTVYTEQIILGKNKDGESNYKCSKLILTTDYNSFDQDEIIQSKQVVKQLEKIIDRLKLNTVNLVNTKYFTDQMEVLVDAILLKNGVKANDLYRSKLIEYSKGKSFKSVQQIIDISIDEVHSDDIKILTNFPASISETILELELHEKAYILKIYDLLDNNMTATANALNIGRSTLYRKLEKYQNETIKDDK
jgi:DNA-binding NtrC family response regulator